MKIFGWAADTAGCGHYRLELPLRELTRHGHDAKVSQRLDWWAHNADVIIGQRICQVGSTEEWQRIAKRPNRPRLVFEVDDDLLTVDHTSRTAFAWFNQPEVRDRLITNARVADVVTVSTEPLAEVMSEFNPDVRVVPNMIPAEILTLPDARRTDGILTLGWAGSSTHLMDFDDPANELVRFVKRNNGSDGRVPVEYHAIGGVFRSMHGLPVAQTRIDQWFDNVAEYYRAIDFHIGIAPLRPHVFNRSKSDVKFLEYAARRAVFVGSDVGPYARTVQHGVTGLLIRTTHEWPRHLRALANDPAMRDELTSNAHAYAATRTIEDNWGLWEKALS